MGHLTILCPAVSLIDVSSTLDSSSAHGSRGRVTLLLKWWGSEEEAIIDAEVCGPAIVPEALLDAQRYVSVGLNLAANAAPQLPTRLADAPKLTFPTVVPAQRLAAYLADASNLRMDVHDAATGRLVGHTAVPLRQWFGHDATPAVSEDGTGRLAAAGASPIIAADGPRGLDASAASSSRPARRLGTLVWCISSETGPHAAAKLDTRSVSADQRRAAATQRRLSVTRSIGASPAASVLARRRPLSASAARASAANTTSSVMSDAGAEGLTRQPLPLVARALPAIPSVTDLLAGRSGELPPRPLHADGFGQRPTAIAQNATADLVDVSYRSDLGDRSSAPDAYNSQHMAAAPQLAPSDLPQPAAPNTEAAQLNLSSASASSPGTSGSPGRRRFRRPNAQASPALPPSVAPAAAELTGPSEPAALPTSIAAEPALLDTVLTFAEATNGAAAGNSQRPTLRGGTSAGDDARPPPVATTQQPDAAAVVLNSPQRGASRIPTPRRSPAALAAQPSSSPPVTASIAGGALLSAAPSPWLDSQGSSLSNRHEELLLRAKAAIDAAAAITREVEEGRVGTGGKRVGAAPQIASIDDTTLSGGLSPTLIASLQAAGVPLSLFMPVPIRRASVITAADHRAAAVAPPPNRQHALQPPAASSLVPSLPSLEEEVAALIVELDASVQSQSAYAYPAPNQQAWYALGGNGTGSHPPRHSGRASRDASAGLDFTPSRHVTFGPPPFIADEARRGREGIEELVLAVSARTGGDPAFPMDAGPVQTAQPGHDVAAPPATAASAPALVSAATSPVHERVTGETTEVAGHASAEAQTDTEGPITAGTTAARTASPTHLAASGDLDAIASLLERFHEQRPLRGALVESASDAFSRALMSAGTESDVAAGSGISQDDTPVTHVFSTAPSQPSAQSGSTHVGANADVPAGVDERPWALCPTPPPSTGLPKHDVSVYTRGDDDVAWHSRGVQTSPLVPGVTPSAGISTIKVPTAGSSAVDDAPGAATLSEPEAAGTRDQPAAEACNATLTSTAGGTFESFTAHDLVGGRSLEREAPSHSASGASAPAVSASAGEVQPGPPYDPDATARVGSLTNAVVSLEGLSAWDDSLPESEGGRGRDSEMDALVSAFMSATGMRTLGPEERPSVEGGHGPMGAGDPGHAAGASDMTMALPYNTGSSSESVGLAWGGVGLSGQSAGPLPSSTGAVEDPRTVAAWGEMRAERVASPKPPHTAEVPRQTSPAPLNVEPVASTDGFRVPTRSPIVAPPPTPSRPSTPAEMCTPYDAPVSRLGSALEPQTEAMPPATSFLPAPAGEGADFTEAAQSAVAAARLETGVAMQAITSLAAENTHARTQTAEFGLRLPVATATSLAAPASSARATPGRAAAELAAALARLPPAPEIPIYRHNPQAAATVATSLWQPPGTAVLPVPQSYWQGHDASQLAALVRGSRAVSSSGFTPSSVRRVVPPWTVRAGAVTAASSAANTPARLLPVPVPPKPVRAPATTISHLLNGTSSEETPARPASGAIATHPSWPFSGPDSYDQATHAHDSSKWRSMALSTPASLGLREHQARIARILGAARQK